MEDDRTFLETQLKNTKRKIKNFQLQKLPAKDFDESVKTSVFQSFDLNNVKFLPSTKAGEVIQEILQKNTRFSEEFLYDLEKFFHELEIKYNESIKHIKNSLEFEKKKNKNISAQQTSLFFVKSDLESLFLECVEEVRKEVSKRRTQSLVNQKFAKRAQTSGKPGGDQLNSSDKRKILEILVSNEQVLVFLYEKLFPYRANQYGNTVKMEDTLKPEEIPKLEELLKQTPAYSSSKVSVHPSRTRNSDMINKIRY